MWYHALDPEKRFRLIEIQYDIIMRLKKNPDPLLENLLALINNGTQEHATTSVPNAMAIPKSKGDDPSARPYLGSRRRAMKISPQQLKRMYQLFEEGYSNNQTYAMLEMENGGKLIFTVKVVENYKTKWNKQKQNYIMITEDEPTKAKPEQPMHIEMVQCAIPGVTKLSRKACDKRRFMVHKFEYNEEELIKYGIVAPKHCKRCPINDGPPPELVNVPSPPTTNDITFGSRGVKS